MGMQKMVYFLSAAKHLNFTKAADECCIAQTSMSQQIKSLEDEVGFQLFIRGKKGVVLTPAGEYFFRQCQYIAAQYNNAVNQGVRISGGDSNSELRIGYAGAYEQCAITGVIKQYHLRHPETRISLSHGCKSDILGRLLDGTLDLAVMVSFDIEPVDGLEINQLSSDHCCFMLSSSHPLATRESVSPLELKGVPIILTNENDLQKSEQRVRTLYASMGLGGNKIVYTNDFYSLMLMVSAGLGFSMVPELLKNMTANDHAFVDIQGYNMTARTAIAHLEHGKSAAVSNFLAMLDNN